jgi:phosphopantetheinyl transferase (holo-ACP synthase)
MIGNDVIDLELAKKENNWQRKGFLDKIFTRNEQELIQKSKNPEIMVWNLWSRKEAAYKIWNRETGIHKYNPIKFECFDLDSKDGKVVFETTIYYTRTEISYKFIHTIAVSDIKNLNQVKYLRNDTIILKKNKIPSYLEIKTNQLKPLSKSNYGSFEYIVALNDA